MCESAKGTVITCGNYSDAAAKHSTYTSATVRVDANDFIAKTSPSRTRPNEKTVPLVLM